MASARPNRPGHEGAAKVAREIGAERDRALCLRVLDRLGISGRAADASWLVTWGFITTEVADVVGVSEGTVKADIAHVCSWLRIRNRRELGRVVRSHVEAARQGR